MGLLDKAKELGEKAASSTQGVTEKSREVVQEKVKNTMTEIQGLIPVLEQSGFIVGDIVVTLSIPPGVKMIVEQTKEGNCSLDKIETKSLSKIQTKIIEALRKAYSLNDSVGEFGFLVGQVELEMTFPPKIHVHLNSDQSRAFQ
jgi:hypothetical protein